MSGPIAYIALYAALYGAFGVASPFWPKYFETRALTPEQIGIILAAALLMRLVAGPLVGMFADFLQSLRLVLAACAGLAAATAVALLWADGFWLLLVVALVQAAALAPTTSIADALSVNAARPQRAGRPFEYGWIRGSASAAFVCGTLIIGQIISPTDLTRVIWLNAALLVVAAGATALVPDVAAQSALHSGASKVASEVHRLLGIARFRVLILVSALIYGSHAMHDAFAVIRWSNAGIDTFVISVLWSEAVAAEVMVFFLIGPALLNRSRCAGRGCARGRSRNYTLVDRWRNDFRRGARDVAALARIDLRSASSRLHAYDGKSHSRAFGRNRPSSLRVWFRRCDCRIDAVFGILLCELWRRGVSCDGASLRPRIAACLVRLFRRAGCGASHRLIDALPPAVPGKTKSLQQCGLLYARLMTTRH
ncbi:MFS transporter [Bradyrhizobium sp. RDT10]